MRQLRHITAKRPDIYFFRGLTGETSLSHVSVVVA